MPGADGLPSVLPAAPADPRPEVFRGWSRVSRRSCCSADASARRLGTWLYGVREWDRGQRTTEHPSEAAARASVGELPQRWAAGAAGLRTVRIYPPDGGVELVDFAM